MQQPQNQFFFYFTIAILLIWLYRKRMIEKDKKSESFKRAKKPVVKRHLYGVPPDARKKLIENWTHSAQEQVSPPTVVKKPETAQNEVHIS